MPYEVIRWAARLIEKTGPNEVGKLVEEAGAGSIAC